MNGPPVNASDKTLAAFVEVKSLIEKAGRVRENLTENERGALEELETRYAVFTAPGFEDKTLLEVMLRNVTVRGRMGVAPGGRNG
ncbi:MAG: hypothetical protein ACYYKD_01620 [Rhodospirillales bacterium]